MRARNGARPAASWVPGPESRAWWGSTLGVYKGHVERKAVPTLPAATAQVTVDAAPEEAFRIFTDEIGLWWRRGTPYWNDRERGLTIRIEPGVGGRFLEVYDLDTETGLEVGRVTGWEPGRRLAITWKQATWPEGVTTEVEVTFESQGERTLVTLRHSGFEQLGAEAESSRSGYSMGWSEVLSWFVEHADDRTG